MPNPIFETKKLTHRQFIKFCAEKDINITRITRHYIYFESPEDKSAFPNYSTLDSVKDVVINPLWQLHDPYENRMITLADIVRRNLRIHAIKLIRQETGLDLSSSKDIIDNSWEAWKRIVL
jgi:hypothetical protein